MSFQQAPARFSRSTMLFEVLRDPRGHALIAEHLPTLVGSAQLHTLHGYPTELVLKTDPQLQDDPAAREQILQQLEAIEPQPAANRRGTTPAPAPAPIEDGERGSAAVSWTESVERFGRFEAKFAGPSGGNPFREVALALEVATPSGAVRIPGFYDGDGVYRARSLALTLGEHRFRTASNVASLDGIEGSFVVTAAPADRHGPVRVADTFHFAFEDGTRYLPIGTTSYAWTHQPASQQDQTVATLATSPFNKMRMCVFPKSYLFNENEPELFPFERGADGAFDYTRPSSAYWANLEHRIDQLAAIGVEVDLILFHAYDRWGFSTMSAADDDAYVAYAVARLASFANIWWSLANEYDLLFDKTEEDWEQFARVVQANDPFGHLLSIHNCRDFYDYGRDWVTHSSIQRQDVYRTSEFTTEWREQWGKPVVIDECAYEGNIDQGWGNISGEEMTRRFWEGAVRGGYVGHGETYVDDNDILWWSKGGVLKGTSPARIQFLVDVLEDAPAPLEPCTVDWDVPRAGTEHEYYLYYFGFNQPTYRRFMLDPEVEYTIDVLDTWDMTVTTLPGTYSGRFVIDLPGKQYMAVRLRAVSA